MIVRLSSDYSVAAFIRAKNSIKLEKTHTAQKLDKKRILLGHCAEQAVRQYLGLLPTYADDYTSTDIRWNDKNYAVKWGDDTRRGFFVELKEIQFNDGIIVCRSFNPAEIDIFGFIKTKSAKDTPGCLEMICKPKCIYYMDYRWLRQWRLTTVV